jgi:hypothetical protein
LIYFKYNGKKSPLPSHIVEIKNYCIEMNDIDRQNV